MDLQDLTDIGIMSSENWIERECGVKSVVDEQRSIAPSVYLCPSNPNEKVGKDIWQLPSFSLDFIPSRLATIEPGYRVVIPYNVPFLGERINDDLAQRIAKLNPLWGQAQGDHGACEHMVRAFLKLGWQDHLLLQLHTDSEFYIDTRVHLPVAREVAKKGHRQRSLFVAENCKVRVAPSQYFINRYRDLTGFNGEIEVFPSIKRPIPLMSAEEKALFRQRFLEDNKIPANLWNRDIVGAVTRVTPEKGIDKVIRSYAVCVEICKAKRKDPPILIFVGEYNEDFLEQLKHLIKSLGIAHLVFFLGSMANPEAMRFLQICLICLLLSLSETQGLVRREAQLVKSVPLVLLGTALAEGLDDDRLILPDDPEVIGEMMFYLLFNASVILEISEHQYQVALRENDPIAYRDRYLGYLDRVRRK